METPNPTAVANGRLRLGAVIAAAAAVAFLAWIVVRGDNDHGKSSKQPTQAPPSLASIKDLKELRASVGHPVYWAGRQNQTYELTRTSNGNIYIRYLSSAADVGAPRPDFLTVGTYPFKHAQKTLQRLGRKQGQVTKAAPGGGLVVANGSNAQNAYLAYPDEDFQVEVFDPQPGRALQLASSGRIRPIP